MKQLWVADLSQDEVLRYFLRPLGSSPLPKLERVEFPRGRAPSFGTLCWFEKPNSPLDLPFALIAPDASQSILPRLMAVPGQVSPVTSVCRVWEVDAANGLFSRSGKPPHDFSRAALIGLVLGELHGKALRSKSLRASPPLEGALSCFGAAAASLALQGGSTEELGLLAKHWIEASNLLGNEPDVEQVSVLAELTSFVMLAVPAGFRGDAGQLGRLVERWITEMGMPIRPDLLSPDLFGLVETFKGATREDRYSSVMAALKDLEERFPGEPSASLKALTSGYLICAIDPTSVDFVELALGLDKRRGLVAAAYLMCSGLVNGGALLGKWDCLGLGIYRRVFLGATSGNAVDISVDELRILKNRISERGVEFRASSSSALELELLPGLSSRINYRIDAADDRHRREAEYERDRERDSSQFRTRLERASQMSRTLQRTIDELVDMQHQGSRTVGRRPKG